MDKVLQAIDQALERKGLSDAAASKLAVGNYALIKNMRAARATRPEDKRYNYQALEKLAAVLDLELYFGPPRAAVPDTSETASPSEFANIPLHDAALAAGNGRENGAEDVIAHLAFRRDWLQRVGVSPAQAVLARVEGDSMAPTIHPRDLVLIDRARRDVPTHKRSPKDTRPSPIFALLDDGKARVKRIERPEPGLVILQSDNPAYGPEFKTGADIDQLNIIGKVVWWGHTVRE